MNDPNDLQAAALAAVDRMIEVARDIDEHTHPGWAGATRARVVELEGRRRIIQRHAPEPVRVTWNSPPQRWQCEHCASLCHSRSGLGCEIDGDAPWPCEEWRDATAGLPLDQERTEEESDG